MSTFTRSSIFDPSSFFNTSKEVSSFEITSLFDCFKESIDNLKEEISVSSNLTFSSRAAFIEFFASSNILSKFDKTSCIDDLSALIEAIDVFSDEISSLNFTPKLSSNSVILELSFEIISFKSQLIEGDISSTEFFTSERFASIDEIASFISETLLLNPEPKFFSNSLKPASNLNSISASPLPIFAEISPIKFLISEIEFSIDSMFGFKSEFTSFLISLIAESTREKNSFDSLFAAEKLLNPSFMVVLNSFCSESREE